MHSGIFLFVAPQTIMLYWINVLDDVLSHAVYGCCKPDCNKTCNEFVYLHIFTRCEKHKL